MTAHQFNDDALGRVLEDLAEHRRTLCATLGAVPKGGSPMTRRLCEAIRGHGCLCGHRLHRRDWAGFVRHRSESHSETVT